MNTFPEPVHATSGHVFTKYEIRFYQEPQPGLYEVFLYDENDIKLFGGFWNWEPTEEQLTEYVQGNRFVAARLP